MAAQEAQPFHWHYSELDDKNFQLNGHSLLLLLIVFSIIILFTLLCLYVRWAFRCHRWPSAPVSAEPATRAAGPCRFIGLDPDALSSLPVRLHVAEGEEDEEEAQCSICLSALVDGDKVKVLPGCGHEFHPECVDEWLMTRSSCPLCRDSLRVLPEGA